MVDNLPERIRDAYSSCTDQEKEYLRRILEELSEYGYSETYNDIWLADYKEIPVSIETFLVSDTYLGKVTRNGEAVYPYWRKSLNEIFDAGNKYNEIVLTGATRIGKSSTGITGAAYMLYRLMCLKNPQKFFNKKEESKFSILFFNITKDLAKGVAYREFNDTLKSSPWFNEHGTFSDSAENFYYIPEGGKIVIEYGSDASHALGQQVYVGYMDECLVGNTQIVTDKGSIPIQSVAGQNLRVLQYNPDTKSTMYVNASVVETKKTTETIRITLEDGSTIEGTPEHPVMLKDGSYKQLGQLTEDDDIMDIDKNNYHVYVHTSLTGKRYVGITLKISSIERITHESPVPVYDVVSAEPYHNFVVDAGGNNIVVHNCNFSKAGIKDVNKAKQHMKDVYNTISARIKGTFRQGGEVYGKLFAISSKRSDSDFMEAYIQDQQAAGAGDHMYIVDEPQWVILPESMFSKERFYIAVGDKNKKGFVVPDNQSDEASLADIRAQGYRLLNPPIDMRPEFIADFDIALRDLAGISVPGSLSFITQDVLNSCISKTRRNPFYSDILSIGTRDSLTLEEFFHLDELDPKIKSCPHFIHLDLSKNTDRTGISDVAITGRKDIKTPDGKVISQPWFTHVFSVAIEAPRGDKIPYAKITTFICWLRKYINIERISRDQFQSEYMAQLLEAQGLTVDSVSLDRTPDGYIALRSILLENRIDMLDCALLQDELIHLQRDSVTGKIDHTISSSKDVSDSFAGATWNAVRNNPGIQVPVKKIASVISSVNGVQTSRNPNDALPMFANQYKKLR